MSVEGAIYTARKSGRRALVYGISASNKFTSLHESRPFTPAILQTYTVD